MSSSICCIPGKACGGLALTLLDREDYGAELQSAAVVLRLVSGDGVISAGGVAGIWQRFRGRGLPRFHPGDLIGILVPDSVVPRFYSLASDRKEGGLVSGALFALQAGDSIQGFVKPNPDLRPGHGRSPSILIGAGTGIGPLTGFVRHNRQRHPMHLYFGAREPQSDFL